MAPVPMATVDGNGTVSTQLQFGYGAAANSHGTRNAIASLQVAVWPVGIRKSLGVEGGEQFAARATDILLGELQLLVESDAVVRFGEDGEWSWRASEKKRRNKSHH